MGVTCQIQIQRPREGVHTAGKPVFGTVRYAVDEPTEYRDITLSLVGKGESSWTEQRKYGYQNGSYNHHRYKTYKGTEVFIESYISVLNKPPGSTVTVPIGTYEYNFRFMLPKSIPPSFEDSICTIAYLITLKFEKPRFFSIKNTFTTELNVYGCVKPEAPEGNATFGLEKTLLRPFSKRTHMINLKADISNRIFSPGDNALISFTITNITDVKITSVKTELVCYTTYTANCGRTKGKSRIISESTVETPGVPAEAVANMSSVLPIQAHLYSIQHCRIMKKEYKVKVTVRLPIPYINASVELPIVIGEQSDERSTETAMFARDVAGPSVESVAGSANGPPSYWEAMKEDGDVKEVMEND